MVDMLKFIDANIGPAETPLEEAMRETHRERAQFGGPNEVGLNWIITNEGDDRIVWHNGGTGGYRTFAGFDPDRNVGAVVLTNSAHGSDDIGMHLINSAIELTPKPAEHVEIEVSQDVLEQYVGEYHLAPEFVITVTVQDGTLWAEATNQPNVQIYPESETRFFYKVVDAQITFEKDDDGNVTGLVLHQMGRDMPAPKQ
jgi:CubicO group peptidase (beta-lactamase class C family)